MPNVYATSRLRNQFSQNRTPEQIAKFVDQFCNAFLDWKTKLAGVPSKGSRAFGKDTPYHTPKVFGEPKLMHVHLRPLVNPTKMSEWNARFDIDSLLVRTSDKVLIYVEADDGDFLLIYILPEGKSHQIAEDARNGVGEAPALMAKFSDIAEDFILRKTIP